MTSLTL